MKKLFILTILCSLLGGCGGEKTASVADSPARVVGRALTLLGAVREFLGTGKIFDVAIMPEEYGMLVFVLAPGAFIALGYLIALINSMKKA